MKCGLSTRKKRSDSNLLRIDFDIAANFENESFVDSFAKFRSHQTDMSLKIKDIQISRSLDFNTSDGRLMETTAVDNYDVKLECPDNTIPSYKTTSCGIILTCIIIQIGWKLKEKKYETKICKKVIMMLILFWMILNYCTIIFLLLVECAAGTFYDDKTETCQMCPKGQYQPDAGKAQCLSCSQGQTTKTKGSQQPAQCEGTWRNLYDALHLNLISVKIYW